MEVKENRADLSKRVAARKNSIDDAIKRTIPVVDAEQAVSFCAFEGVSMRVWIFCVLLYPNLRLLISL